MNSMITGTITSSDIGIMGKVRYGYIGVETEKKENYKVKITAFTKSETFEIGSKVTIELQTIGDTGLLNAKTISLIK
jgi:hypothetical protein